MAKKKTTKKKTTRKKSAATSEVKPRTKTQIYGEIADNTGLSRKEVACVFDAMAGMVKKDLGRRGPGTFTVPGLMKIRKHRKPATKRRWGKNPFTGEEQWFKAKPAKNVVKFTALKNLKEMV
ncbi:MAG: HU family DNA-binding protein [Phycisphaerales bacterium]|nr:HU family DNA-binding protein [Phycisphaerales bacterium]